MTVTGVNEFFVNSLRVKRLSQVIGGRGDIDSPAKVAAIAAAMQEPGLEAFIFDRALAITSRTLITGSHFFPHVAGLICEGKPSKAIDCTGWGRTGPARTLFGGGPVQPAPVALTADVQPGQSSIALNPAQVASLGVQRGDKVLLTSDRIFVQGGTFVLILSGTIAPVIAEILTQATSGATGKVNSVTTTAGITTVTLETSTGQFTIGPQLTGSVSGGLGAASAVATVQTPEAQSEVFTVVDVSGDVLAFWPRTRDTYLVAQGARLARMNLSRRPQFLGLAAEAPGQMTALVTGDRMFSVLWTDEMQIDGCQSKYFDNGNYFYAAQGGRISLTGWAEPRNGRSMNQYCVSVFGPSEGVLVEDVTGHGFKHVVVQSESMAAPGVTRDMTVRGTRATNSWNNAVAWHTNSIGGEVTDSVITDCNGGIEAGCIDFTSRRNWIRGLPYTLAPGDTNTLLGIGINVTDFGMGVRSFDDRIEGGRWPFRLNTAAFPLIPGSTGPGDITIERLEAMSFKEDGVQILSTLGVERNNVHLRGIRTRRAGYNPPSAVSGAPSIEISGLFNRVTIADCDLQAEPGNVSACIVTEFVKAAHVRDVVYAGHAAPRLEAAIVAGEPDITSTNVRAY